jgi:predicted transcriptional regulator
MDFKKATDELMAGMTRGEIADALGCSEATVRQARLAPATKAYRRPPDDWEGTVARLAAQKSEHLRRLVKKLRG